MGYLLDACALIAFLNDEAGAEQVEAALNQQDCYVHAINIYELYKDCLATTDSVDDAKSLLVELESLGLQRIERLEDTVLLLAATIKLQYKMAIPDAFGVATAIERRLIFLTSDAGELTAPRDAGMPIEFFR
jgi:PIN domain nuclease of toxin-antitoxin system